MKSARRRAMEEARRSKRPSRQDSQAGRTATPDRVLDGSGFPRLLEETSRSVAAAATLGESVSALLTLNGHVDHDVGARALTPAESAAVEVLTGESREDEAEAVEPEGSEDPAAVAFTGWLGIGSTGRPLVGFPGTRALTANRPPSERVARWVEWSLRDVLRFRDRLDELLRWESAEISDCRSYVEGLSSEQRSAMLEEIRTAARRTPPVGFYRNGEHYSNFVADGNIGGKSLVFEHPNCFLFNLDRLPVRLWPDDELVVATTLWLLIRSGGYATMEEVNGSELTAGRVARLFEWKYDSYAKGPSGVENPGPLSSSVAVLAHHAEELRELRKEMVSGRLLYRRIHGPMMHKVEHLVPGSGAAGERVARVAAEVGSAVGDGSGSFDGVLERLEREPGILENPLGEFGTGLEHLVHSAVRACVPEFGAHFAMSRGLRKPVALLEALRNRDHSGIVSWEITDYYCCVVPGENAAECFGDDWLATADAAWAMAARMQYNSWHVLPGNLPQTGEVVERDYLSPATMPDIATFSDQHHRGHVTNRIRFSIRSPRAVEVLGDSYASFVDLRLLRCAGDPFTTADLVDAEHVSRFLGALTSAAMRRVAEGVPLEITAFDHEWHRRTIAGAPSEEE